VSSSLKASVIKRTGNRLLPAGHRAVQTWLVFTCSFDVVLAGWATA